MTTTIEPATMEHLEALIAGGDAYRARFGMTVAEGYLDSPDVLEASCRGLLRGAPPEWFSHLILDAAAGEVIGFGGFKGPPLDGEVEIGYSVAPAHRGRGRATVAVREMIERAREAGVRRICAHTLKEDNASTRLLGRVGFRPDGVAEDREDGHPWRWELRL